MKPFKNYGLKIMTAKAFVLINAEVGREQDLIRQLRSIPNVTEVHVVYGVYDVIAKVEANTMEKVKETITNSLRRLDNVRSTLTMIAVEEDLT
jgi:DNA-binding Lrp family transcriptional regulator